jgi:DNA modification methylase
MNVKFIAIDRINPAPYNPRVDLKPTDPRYARIVKSLDAFGLVEPLVWNTRTGNLVGGHQRLKVLRARGDRKVPVSVVDLPLEKEKALNLALNKAGGDWDRDALASLLSELTTTADLGFDIEATGFAASETEQLISGLVGDGNECDAATEPTDTTPPIAQPGDVFCLGVNGEHTLVCGDATDPESIRRALGDRRADLLHTDPPYGVSYDRRARPGGDRSAPAELLQNDGLSPKRYAAWFTSVAKAFTEGLRPGAPFYIWNGHSNFGLMADVLRAEGFLVSAVITWAKESFAPGYSDYSEQTEFALYGWRSGRKHAFYGPSNASTLWSLRRDPTRSYVHPTQKPLELAERAIRNSSKRGETVLDPFLGGGTTLIASARLGRRCAAVEIDPKYCDAAIRRYAAVAGVDALPEELRERYGMLVAS